MFSSFFCHLKIFVNRLLQYFLFLLALEGLGDIRDLASGCSQKIGGGNFSLPYLLKGALSGLRQFLVTERPLKMNLKSSFRSHNI